MTDPFESAKRMAEAGETMRKIVEREQHITRAAAESLAGLTQMAREPAYLKPIMPDPHQIQSIPSLMSAFYADAFYKRLRKYIARFEKSLDDEHEIGIQLVSFGRDVTIQVTDMGYYNPALISFTGMLPDGSPTQLIQNVSQISFLLVALKRTNLDQPKRRIGFLTEDDGSETEA